MTDLTSAGPRPAACASSEPTRQVILPGRWMGFALEMPRRAAIVLAAFLVVLGPARAAQAEISATEPTVVDVQVGLGGRFKLGKWTPVTIQLRAGSEPLSCRIIIEADDGDGVACQYLGPALNGAPQESVTVRVLVKLSGSSSTLRVLLQSTGQTGDNADTGLAAGKGRQQATWQLDEFSLRDLATPILSSQLTVLTVGQTFPLRPLITSYEAGPFQAAVALSISSLSELPYDAAGLAGIDTMLLTTSDFDAWRSLEVKQLDALYQWVLDGGRLLICVGSQGQKFSAAERYARFLPGRNVQISTDPTFSGLSSFAGATSELVPSDPIVPMTVLDSVDGVILADAGQFGSTKPALVQAPLGFGQILFVAFDLDREPFMSWSDRNRLISQLLRLLLGANEDQGQRTRSLQASHIGYRDIMGQLAAALGQFASVSLLPFWFVVALALIYLLLIGPADYFFLRRMDRGMGWTWLTFSAVVIVTSVTAYQLSRLWHGEQIRVNQLFLVDIDARSGWVRGNGWSSLFSANSRVFDITLEQADDMRPAVTANLSWMAQAGAGFGCVDTTNISLASWKPYRTVVIDNRQAKLDAFPVGTWSSRSLRSHWNAWWPAPDLQPASRLVAAEDGSLAGEIHNPLDVVLDNCWLMHDQWIYPVQRLDLQETISVEELELRTLEYYLTRRRVDMDELENVPTAWDPADRDIQRIMEMTMFQHAAGGSAYTKLNHRFERTLDLSPHLHLHRAILVGRSSQAAANLKITDVPPASVRQWNYYRIVFPVSRPTEPRPNASS